MMRASGLYLGWSGAESGLALNASCLIFQKRDRAEVPKWIRVHKGRSKDRFKLSVWISVGNHPEQFPAAFPKESQFLFFRFGKYDDVGISDETFDQGLALNCKVDRRAINSSVQNKKIDITRHRALIRKE